MANEARHLGSSIARSAVIGPAVTIGEGCTIGEFVVIRGRVTIGPGCVIEDFCSIGSLAESEPLRIGAGSVIRSHSIIYGGSDFGTGLQTGNRVVIRAGAKVGANVSIGTGSDIQGLCTIGDNSRLHSNVHVCQYSSIGKFTWLFPGVILTNDPRPPSAQISAPVIGDFAVITVNCAIMPGSELGPATVVLPNTVVSGFYPAESIVFSKNRNVSIDSSVYRLTLTDLAYPWPERFGDDYYPEHIAAELASHWQRYKDLKKSRTE